MTLAAPLLILGLAAASGVLLLPAQVYFQTKRLSKGTVRFRGKFSPHRKADTANFLLHELALTGRVRIVGTRTHRHILRIDVYGVCGSQQFPGTF